MVYSISGQRMACAVIIVIYHDGISIVHLLSQVLRSCTELYRCREPFLCPPRAVPLDLQTNLVAEAWHWVLGTARHQPQGDDHHERLHQCCVRPFGSSTQCSMLRA